MTTGFKSFAEHDFWCNRPAQGARLATGGQRQGALYQPTVVADTQPAMRVCRDELFGPAVAVMKALDLDDAIRLANDSRYGLSAAIFTQDLGRALQFARHVDSGNIQINWGPAWRADLMPYGGLKESGLGKEGPRYAIQEMTESKTVIVHGL
jgi:glyceraldehyde-3-phosphate dehydrogenase (NADP+)